jgi:hypothetical protein
MPSGFQSLRRAISGAAPPSGYRWEELLADLWPALSSPLTVDGEHLLLEILRFNGRLRIDLSSEMPHSKSPEDMLKSLAIQALARWTGLAYLREMQRVQATTSSSSLSSLIRDVIQKARETNTDMWRRPASEEIAESSPQAASTTVTRPLEKDHGMSFVPGRRFRVPNRELELVN